MMMLFLVECFTINTLNNESPSKGKVQTSLFSSFEIGKLYCFPISRLLHLLFFFFYVCCFRACVEGPFFPFWLD